MPIRLNGSTSGYTEIQAPAVAGSNTLTLPNSNGSNAQVLSTNGSGTLSWATATIAAASTSVAGAVQLSDSTSTTSSVLAATPTAVKAAYDLAAAPGTSISVGNTSATVTDTGSNGALTVVTEGSTRLTANNNGVVIPTLVGGQNTAPLNTYSVAYSAGPYANSGQINWGTSQNPTLGPLFHSSVGVANVAVELTFVKSNGNSPSSYAGQTLLNNALGYINFLGTDGYSPRPCVSIQAFAEGNVVVSDSPGRLVFGTTPSGTSVISEKLRITPDGVIAYNQQTPLVYSNGGLYSIGDLKFGIIQLTAATASTLTLPTGTSMESGFAGIYTNMAFQWSLINTGAGICTIAANTAHTIVGSGTINPSTSAQFASRRTAANTFVSYRLS